MATVDLSRFATDFRKHFSSLRAQMGRVLTDDDFNDNERLHGEDERRTRVDVIGPAGSPDQGFRIQNPTIAADGRITFDILPGVFYLGGNRLELEQTEQFQTQADWVNLTAADRPASPGNVARFDLVYLECWQQPVSAVEDSELFEVALGGPDTSARLRLMRRVRVFAGGAVGDCHQDWATLTAQWTAAGLGTLNAQDELVVDTRLQVGFEPGSAKEDLCTPFVNGGYLGADNQAIRVQLVDPSHFTWGFDNAAPLYRVTIGPNDAGQKRKVTMLTEPKDQAHWPTAGQIVELLPWSARLANNEKVAEVRGFLARVDGSYDPDTQELFLAADVPADFGQDWLTRPDAGDLQPEFFFLRVWNRGSDTTSPVAIPLVNGVATSLGNTGLNVTFTGNDHHPDDFWVLAARPEAPNRVVPWLLETGRGPHGIRRFYAPLAVIQWTPAAGTPSTTTGTVVHDCRDQFPPLTRRRSCCTHTVGDGAHSFGAFTKIQEAIDALPDDGGEVCVLPGVYKESIRIVKRHGIRVHGCGARTILMEDGSGKSAVVTIQDSQHIAICHLAVQAPAAIGIQLGSSPGAEAKNVGLERIDLDDLDITVRDRSAIDCRGGRFLCIRGNHILAQALAGPLSNQATAGHAPLVFVRGDDVLIEGNRIAAGAPRRSVTAAGGLHVGGGSERVEVRRNKIAGGNGNGITLGSVSFQKQDGGIFFPPGDDGSGVPFMPIHLLIDDAGCIHPEPNPTPPTDPAGDPLVPVSDGDLLDVRILDNDIHAMGQSGIATLRFFPRGLGPVVVRGLDIEQNRIAGCLQLELGNQPFGAGFTVGFGGVALVAVEEFTLRNNWIEGNGRSFIDPVCGVFVGLGRGLILESNVIADNGPRVATNQQPTAGPRGGIVVRLARPPLSGGKAGTAGTAAVKAQFPREGFPAARIAGNTVIAPLGCALSLGALGLVSVEGNAFTSRGVDRDANLLGAAVTIHNLGIAEELGGVFPGFTILGKYQPAGGISTAAAALSPFLGGKILFNDNQVLLAPVEEDAGIIRSSVMLATLDHALMDGNQSVCRFGRSVVLANAWVMGWSVHVTDNRFVERLNSLGVSAFSLAVLNCTTDNVGTRCFLIFGIPALTVNEPNRSLVTLSNPNVCRGFTLAVGPGLTSTGLSG